MSGMRGRSGTADLGTGGALQRVGILFDGLSVQVVGSAEDCRKWIEGRGLKLRRREYGLLEGRFERWGEIQSRIGCLVVRARCESCASLIFGPRQIINNSS
jgi:hypothetical protein